MTATSRSRTIGSSSTTNTFAGMPGCAGPAMASCVAPLSGKRQDLVRQSSAQGPTVTLVGIARSEWAGGNEPEGEDRRCGARAGGRGRRGDVVRHDDGEKRSAERERNGGAGLVG